jgi:hypothetical protein
VKRVGEILSFFFNKSLSEDMLETAEGYSELFSSWAGITEKNGIPAAAFHSRIVELEKAVLLVEADHPGWIQILQTKQTYLLKTVIRLFPDLEIRGISFRLSRDPLSLSAGLVSAGSHVNQTPAVFSEQPPDLAGYEPETAPVPGVYRDYFERIEDKAFLETLKRLEKLERRGKARQKD